MARGDASRRWPPWGTRSALGQDIKGTANTIVVDPLDRRIHGVADLRLCHLESSGRLTGSVRCRIQFDASHSKCFGALIFSTMPQLPGTNGGLPRMGWEIEPGQLRRDTITSSCEQHIN